MPVKRFCAILCLTLIVYSSSGDTNDQVNYQKNASINDVLAYLAILQTNMNEQFQTLNRGQQHTEKRIQNLERSVNQSCKQPSPGYSNMYSPSSGTDSILGEIEDSLRDIQNVSEIRHEEMLSELRKYTEMINGESSMDDNSSCNSKCTRILKNSVMHKN